VTSEGKGAAPPDGLLRPDWREAALTRVLTLSTLAGPPAVVTALAMHRTRRIDLVTLAVGAAVMVVLAMRSLPRLGLVRRTWVAVGALLFAAVVPMVEFGLLPGTALTMALAAVIAALALGRSPALLLTGLSAAGIAGYGWLVARGVFVTRYDFLDPTQLVNWLRPAAVYAVITSVLVVLIDQVIGHLTHQYAATADALRRLEGEVSERETRERLQSEGVRALQRLALSEVVESGRLREAFGQITEAGAQALGVERCSVWLLDESGERLRCFDLYERQSGRHTQGMALLASDYPEYFAALAEERALAADDACRDPRTRALAPRYLAPHGIGSLLDAPIRYGERVVGVVCHEHVGPPRPFGPEASVFAGSIGDFAARALAAADRTRKDGALREAYEQLVQLYRRLEGAKEEERREIAHELHDELGQSLTAVKLRLQMLARGPGGAAVAGDVGESLSVIDALIARVRRIAVDLRPPLLDEVGLGPALRAYLDAQGKLTGLPITFVWDAGEGRMPAEVEIGAFRVVQEGLTNVLRHADAHSVRIEVRREPALLGLRVHDDGRGFDVEAARQGATRGSHFGLVGMRERLRGLGGTLEIRSAPGRGTEVQARLPLG
jgi:signal transduction histidine kinase